MACVPRGPDGVSPRAAAARDLLLLSCEFAPPRRRCCRMRGDGMCALACIDWVMSPRCAVLCGGARCCLPACLMGYEHCCCWVVVGHSGAGTLPSLLLPAPLGLALMHLAGCADDHSGE